MGVTICSVNQIKFPMVLRTESSGICGQRRPRSACASLTESLDATKCMTAEQRPGLYFARAQDDLNQRILRMFGFTLFA